MKAKPTYEELERRVQELEKIESEFEVIKADKQRLEMILSSLDTGLSLINPDYTISWVNDTIRSIFPNGDPVGKTCHRFYESSEHICNPCPTFEAYKSGQTQKMDKYNPSKNKWYSIISQPVKDEAGQIVSVLEGITEITERKTYEQQILKEKNLLQQVMETSPVGITMVDKKGNVSMANARAEEILGLERSNIYKRLYNDQKWQIKDIQGNEYPDDQLPFELVRKSGKSVFGIKHSLVWPDGEKVLLSINATPLLDRSGNFNGMVAALVDITERKKTEVLLQEKTTLLQNIIDTTSDLISVADMEGKFKFIGPSHSILGYDADLLVGRNVMEFVHPDDYQETATAFAEFLTNREDGRKVEYRYRRADGDYLWFETVGKFILDDVGNPKEILFSTRDVTERKQAEKKLQISEKRVRAKLNAVLHPEGDMGYLSLIDIIDTAKIQHLMDDLYELTNIGGAIVDLDGNVVASTEWREICARFHRKHPDSLKNCIESDTKLTDGIEPGQFREYRCKNNMWDIATPIFIGDKIFGNIFIGQFFYDDEEIDYSAFRSQAHKFSFDEQAYMAALDCVPRFSRNDVKRAMSYYSRLSEILSTLSYSNMKLARTIEEHRRTERERDKLQSQLLQAQKMESVGRLAGGVAHDFNNMLGVILGHTELALLQADENHDLHSDLKEIQKAAKRSADITKQLLAFARKQTISPKQLDLNNTVESMLNMLRRLIGEDIDLVWKPSAHLWPVKMDPSQIDQIMANLCINAKDAISGVGKITIETGKKTFDEEYCNEHPGFIPGDFVLLAVSDNGCGMDKETLDNLFEPFFTTKEVGKGTGLGLATIYGIVKQNNGFINVYSEPGQGSTFKIYLPRLIADETTDTTVPEKKAAAGGAETILLVEDESTILRMIRKMLERKGYSVLPAATPAEAIDMAKAHADQIHLLMTDVVMPEMNGRDLAGQITALYPDIKLLFMSGYTANVIAHHGVLDDGVAFIQKPFSMADMTAKVRDVLDTASDKAQ